MNNIAFISLQQTTCFSAYKIPNYFSKYQFYDTADGEIHVLVIQQIA
jgi:hypothetical protein